ncbi:MAG: hypothetical protein HY926_01460 [Elusimicrobia bacterium]|nr:hypothetical protein [Elusimicrobiota bacterium]
MRRRTSRERWVILMRHVRGQYPHGIMYGVNVADGIIVSCDKLQPCLSLEPSPAAGDGAGKAFDANWEKLEALCGRMGTGRLSELRFNEGRPVSVLPPARGWRFGRRTDN